MRLLHVVAAVALVALVLTLWREPELRVLLIVLTTGMGEVAIGLVALMLLFQTHGALGEAKDLPTHAEALAATSVVLVLFSALMGGWLFVGIWVIREVV